MSSGNQQPESQKQVWEFINERWQEGGMCAKESDFANKRQLYKFAKNDIRDLIARIKELEAGQKPVFIDGLPVTIAAAALDAKEWLLFWREYMNARSRQKTFQGRLWDNARHRMAKAISMIDWFIPDKPNLYFPEAVASLEISAFPESLELKEVETETESHE